jgi:hypothetical protein
LSIAPWPQVFVQENCAMKKTAQGRDPIEQAVLNAFEVALEAQLRAIRRAKGGGATEGPRVKRTSQLDMVQDVLRRAGKPLHISEILDRVEKQHGQRLDRESVVSSLVKKIARGERFLRTDKNVFTLQVERP